MTEVKMTVWTKKHLLGTEDLTKDDILLILDQAAGFKEVLSRSIPKVPTLRGKTIASLFCEPSTRTRTSFDLAAKRLSADTVGITTSSSSFLKGESLKDTVRNIEAMNVDIIIVRHSSSGAPHFIAQWSKAQIVNAGDGSHEHPTQALLDLYTMRKELGTIDGLNVGLVGDLRFGRTVHSLAYALSQYKVRLFLISPDILRMRREVLEEVSKRIMVKEGLSMAEHLKELDVIYMTRVQKERFADLAEYEKVKGAYRLNAEELAKAKKNSIVMHPLPRVDEIEVDVDATPHAKYFQQVWYGLVLRMGLLGLVLGAI